MILDAAAEVVEGLPPGADLTLQDIADRAGMVHTVVRRHFGGRLALVRAVQADVLEQAFELISGPVDPTITLHENVHGYVSTAVAWSDAHESLHALVERELGDGEPSELNRAIHRYTERLVGSAVTIGQLFGVEIEGEVRAEWQLLFAGVIGQVRATLGFWLAQQPRVVGRDQVSAHLATTISRQVVDAIAELGVVIDPSIPLIDQISGPENTVH